MKAILFLVVIAFGAAPLMAETSGSTNTPLAVTNSRVLQQFGVLLSSGQESGFSVSNWGVSIRSFTYFDGTQPDGAYFAFLSGTIIHNLGGNSINDLRILGLGWRGNPFAALGQPSPFDFSLDGSAAPVATLRLKPQELTLDSASLGLGCTIGFYLPIEDWGDLGISWEPVVDLHLLAWGNPRVRDADYSDFVVSWVVKTATETRTLPWKSER